MASHTQGRRQGPGWPHLRTRECAPEQFAAASLTPGRPLRSSRVLRPARRARTRALLTAEGCAAAGVVGTGVTGAQRGARRSAQQSSLRAGCPPTRPRSHGGAEGAERPAPSQALAGGAPGDAGQGSGRPLLGTPWDSPGIRAQSLLARSRRLPPETWQEFPGVLTLSATRVLGGLGQVS